jgi:hypothetical protein
VTRRRCRRWWDEDTGTRIGDQVDTENWDRSLIGQQHRGHLGDIQEPLRRSRSAINPFFPAQIRALSHHLRARVRFHMSKRAKRDICRLK